MISGFDPYACLIRICRSIEQGNGQWVEERADLEEWITAGGAKPEFKIGFHGPKAAYLNTADIDGVPTVIGQLAPGVTVRVSGDAVARTVNTG